MAGLSIHHVALVVTDLERSIEFYQRVFGFDRLQRPPFSTAGVWLACGELQLHLIKYDEGCFRRRPFPDVNDWHFAFRTDDFDGMLQHLVSLGFREDAEEGDPRLVVVRRTGVAGFPQLYFIDPDNNIIEVNGAPAHQPPLWQPPTN